MKKRKRNGFTLIELLAVIVIMGILMMVAIPSISRVIENSRKDTFVDIAKSYANSARTLWTTDGLTCEGTVSSAVDDGDYYILINTKDQARDLLPVLLDQGGKSSWGNRDVNGYVRVNVSTTPGQDTNGDGIYEVEPKRTTKFYVALSDGTHGLVDDGNIVSDKLVKGNVNMSLSAADKKKVELTVDDGKLNCTRTNLGTYICTSVTPTSNISGVCVDDQSSVLAVGQIEINPVSFATDDWTIVTQALKSGQHPYQVGDTKEVDMGSFGTHTLRIANLSTPAECSTEGFSQTACGVVLEFADIITNHAMNSNRVITTAGGWPTSTLREYLKNDIYNALPSELQSAIISIVVASGNRSKYNSNYVTTDKLYLLSTAEVWENGASYDGARDSTRQLDYYADLGVTTNNYSGVIKKYNGTNSSWWLRAAYNFDVYSFYVTHKTGKAATTRADNIFGVSPAFRIG